MLLLGKSDSTVSFHIFCVQRVAKIVSIVQKHTLKWKKNLLDFKGMMP